MLCIRKKIVLTFLMVCAVVINGCSEQAKVSRDTIAPEPKREITLGRQDFLSKFRRALVFGKIDEARAIIIQNPEFINRDLRDGRTPLHFAASSGSRDLVEFLIKKGAYVNSKDKSGSTPLHYAVMELHKDVVETLLANGANVDALTDIIPGSTRDTSLILLVINSPNKYKDISKIIDVGKLLIDNGADVNALSQYGKTSLHIAINYGQKDIIEFLIENGANINIISAHGDTPLDLALSQGHRKLALQIYKNGGVTGPENSTPTWLSQHVDPKDKTWNTPHELFSF